MRLPAKALFCWTIVILVFFALAHSVFAETTLYRGAGTITTDGNTPYTNLSNCSATDDATCDHVSAPLFANLYFRDFGDFGIPDGSTITYLKIRVTGKANLPAQALFTGASIIGSPILFASNCQAPSDLWTMFALNSPVISTYNVTTPLTVGTLAACFSLANIKSNNFIFRVNYSKSVAWSASIDNFEIAFDYIPAATPTPTPTPAGPEPFLDLPWDYEAQGQTFSEAALSIKSFFDHEYPLLGNLIEPDTVSDTLVKYNGTKTGDFYSSHNGYDYAKLAKVNLGDDVLSAAAGTAELITSCGACGNMIVIDHENGYQTKYMHLLDGSPSISTPGVKVHVNAHQKIGEVGFSGHVEPEGPEGAHIHFGVYQDKNDDGNMGDNVLDGLTDPFGWQSEGPDPWENYSFFYGGIQRSGNKSYYLWKKSLGGTSSNLTSSGGNFSAGRYSIDFPSDAVSQSATIELTPEPIVAPSANLSSVGSTLLATAKDLLGNIITNFPEPFTLTIYFSNIDLSRYNTSTLSIYSSQDGEVWNQELTDIDFINNKATTTIAHFTHFALMAERLDALVPTTTAILSGEQGITNWFKSDVSASLSAQDNDGGLGIDYTMYKLNDEDWQQYLNPLLFSDEGHYKIEFYSVDNDENMEDVKSVEFDIDKTPPEAEIKFNVDTLDVDIIGHDSSGSAEVNVSNLPRKKNSIKVTDQAGNTLELIGKEKERGHNAKVVIESLKYNQDDSIDIDPARLLINYNLDNATLDLRKLTQTFEIRGELKIKLIYSAKTDKTQVITKVKGQGKVKEELSGIRILKLTTENGTLNYSY